jgi:ATP-dependent DNA helicase RecQ
VLQDVYTYFKETETDDLEKAQSDLADYTDTEIRLVRIKFFSDMAN